MHQLFHLILIFGVLDKILVWIFIVLLEKVVKRILIFINLACPFGRLFDSALSAKVNGADPKDALLGGLFNEITQGIQNPKEGDLFNGKGERVDTGTDTELGDAPGG